MDAYRLFLLAVRAAVAAGEVGEDFSLGHSRMVNQKARQTQEAFLPLAEENQKLLQDVLRNAADPEHRAIAAYVIGYVKTKRLVVDDLQYAMRDPDETVRNHAMRTLGGFAMLAMKDPELGIKVAPTWFIEMLTSLVWTDRNNATVSLVNLTESRDERMLAHLRERALPALVEMARWKHLPHALPAFILLGRVQGIPEKEIQDTWSSGNREKLIARALEKKKK
jgi:HEAT repeat protein